MATANGTNCGTLSLSDEDRGKLQEDCDRLFLVVKSCRNSEANEENLDILYRIVFLISYRNGLKILQLTNATIGYLCHHPILPVTLANIVKESKNIQISAYALEILAKIVIKNNVTQEIDRKSARKCFQDPLNFKTLVDALQFLIVWCNPCNEPPTHSDMQIRLLKIINCVYVRKGFNQISLITKATVDFLVQHFVRFQKTAKEIAKTMLPLIKVLCRNKKNCPVIGKNDFLNALFAIVPAYNKYPAAVSILRLLTKNPEAISEISRSEAAFLFIINTATNHAEKSQSKKYLMGALCRLTKNHCGARTIAKNNTWLALLDFFAKSQDRLDEIRKRTALTMAYTILHRGVPTKTLKIRPLKLNSVRGKSSVQRNSEKMAARENSSSDESDFEESDEEDEPKDKGHLAETEDEDGFSSDSSSDDCDYDSDTETLVEDRQNFKFVSDFFRELDPLKSQDNCVKFRADSEAARVDNVINREAFPDRVLAESEPSDNSVIPPNVNHFNIDEMVERIKKLKGFIPSTFLRKVVYDLDDLIGTENDVIDVPQKFNASERAIPKPNKLRNVPVLRFESRFECGNLRRCEQIGDYEYDLFVSPDMNTTSGLQWFYFQVSNMLRGKTYVFNIVNFQKVYSQFNYGLQPVLFSAVDYSLNGTGWKKVGDRIMYFGNEYVNRDNDKHFRTLRMAIVFPHDNDYCYLAYHFPYTYTRLMNLLSSINTSNSSLYCRIDKLTDTVNKIKQVPLVTVTNFGNSIKKKPLVFLTARVHPGESNASWIMDGIVRYLTSDEKAAKDARENYIFKIIPMLNPEGVIYGKCCLTGSDLNRCWKKPHPVLHPEIYYAKKLVEHARESRQHPIRAFIDIHGHSRKKYFFLYGCNPGQSWNDDDKSTADPSDASSYALMEKALAFDENMKVNFCRYTIERKREATCRVVMWREFAIKNSYTLECSFCSGDNKKRITTKLLRNIGRSIVIALANLATNSNADNKKDSQRIAEVSSGNFLFLN